MAAHALFDLNIGGLQLLDLDNVYRAVLTLLGGATFIWISHRLVSAAAAAESSSPPAELAPASPTTLP